ncbi:YncE family protein [Proteiniphilum sp. UBA5384]|uniref:YncE family protein n=1 Tax=Proteiniphilum sp. UBA5384 TaxID=1947279 RepID=UPI0025FB4E34|nr:hypothetical protein [Proteiniphilum sp. UBA5384]
MNQKKIFFYLTLLAALFITACSDDDNPIDNGNPSTEGKTLLILSEGSWNGNNSTLARYDLSTRDLDKDYFKSVNKRGLGDTGNDMLLYGSKVYIIVNMSSTIEVMNVSTGISQSIEMKKEDGSGKQPRRIASHNGKVYVTSFDDTVTCIDTTSLAISGSVDVGMNPEAIVVKNNKLYVANSGFGFDNTVSVIDISGETMKEEKKIEVGPNPVNMGSDSQGDLYISLMATYDQEGNITEAASFKRIKPASGEVETIEAVESPDRFVIADNKAYIISNVNGTSKIVVYDCLQEKVVSENFIQDGTKITNTIYNISADEKSGEFFITETDYTTPGSVYCFDKDGKLQYTIADLGINPTTAIVLR